MPSYFLWTEGCQMNKADSSRLASFLESWGFTPSPINKADIIIVNTCVVRQKAEDKAISYLNSLNPLRKIKPDTKILLTGCLVDSRADLLYKRFPFLDFCFRPQDFNSFLAWAKDRGIFTSQPDYLPNHPPVSAFVPAIHGCDYFCTYCIVPFRRGREISRPIPEIVAEVKELVRRGTKEITLVGQNVNSYGHDLPQKPDLSDLLSELNKIPGIYCLRFLTSHPKDITNRFINTVARLDKVCPQFSLPAQSGDDGILELMRRGYTSEYYRELVRKIRETIPDASISTDVIVGFPGEGEREFENTYRLIEEIKPDITHVAAYSLRPGTWAARNLKDEIPLKEKKARLNKIEMLQQRIAQEINSKLEGEEVEILIEGKQKGKWFGRTKSGKLVFLEEEGELSGRLALVKVEKATPWWLGGRLVKCLK